MNNRIEWLDIAKGIGIILVILGHCVYYGRFLHNVIFAFHMPMFFMLSGIVFKHSNNIVFAKKKIKALIIPYILFCVLGLIISIIIPSWRNNLQLKGILKDIYMANPNAINVSSIWFLIAMFWVVILYNLISKYCRITKGIIISILFIVGILFSKISISILPDSRLPMNLDVALVAIAFFAIGDIVLKNIELDNIYLIVICTILFIISEQFNGTVNLHGMAFNNPILYVIESIAGTFIIIIISKYMDIHLNRVSVMIKWLGRKSLTILGIQAIGVRIYILIANYVDDANYWLYGLPLQHQILSFVFVMIVSIGSCFIIDFIRRLINE